MIKYAYEKEMNGMLEKMFSLEGKVALVTGAAYGIGFSMAQALSQAGER